MRVERMLRKPTEGAQRKEDVALFIAKNHAKQRAEREGGTQVMAYRRSRRIITVEVRARR